MAFITETDRISLLIERASEARMSLAEIIDTELQEFMASDKCQLMITAEQYYRNRSDVQNKTNKFENRSNTKLEHPILRKLIDQKTNYLLSKTWTIDAPQSKVYSDALNDLFDDTARRTVKSWGKEAIKKGIAWVQLYFDNNQLRFKRLPSEQVLPEWKDEEHTQLDSVIRYYPQIVYEGRIKKTVIRVEYWDASGVKYYVKEPGGILIPDVDMGIERNHFEINGQPYNWNAPPFIWLKYNEEELPLLYFIKELIDDVNWQKSITADILRDIANFIYILKNYGGQDLNEFVHDLREALAIKVNGDGGVDKLSADLNIDAVVKFLDIHRRDIYDYARSVDTQDPNLGNASGQALKFRYADLDMDMNDLEQEFKAAFMNMKPFIDTYFQATGRGDFTKYDFDITFNRDIIINETEAIANAKASVGLISEKTIIKNHPWVEDADEEIRQMNEEKKERMQEFGAGLFEQDFNSGGNTTQQSQNRLQDARAGGGMNE